MSLVSVLEGPTYAFQYPEGYNIVDALVVRRLGAYDDQTSIPQDLVVGASSNVQIEAKSNIQMFMNTDGAFDLFTSSWNGTTRTDTRFLNVKAPDANTTLLTTESNQVLTLRSGDTQKTVMISGTEMTTDVSGSNQFLSLTALGDQFYFNNEVNIDRGLQVTGNTVVSQSLLVGEHLITYGNIYGSNLNLWRQIDSNLPENNNISQIGYGFRVNSNHQLELVKYSKFADKTVAKKVALFGQAKFNDAMNSDDGIVYDSLNDILGQTNLPEMPNASNTTVDLSQPINNYWAVAPKGIHFSKGFVGISNVAPQYELDVGGEARFVRMMTDVAVIRQATTTSDARLKTNVTDKSPADCFDAINSLRVTSYNFIKDGDEGREFDGLIAQEVEKVFPNAVTESKYEGLDDCRLIDYNQIIVNLIGAVQHLSDLVQDKLTA